ncbi:MAG TPA: alpha/beta fold hydrolase [Moraxellaceae bacterium]|nr:alpha/beta fold hydrolase [Moraxellaceae bacterium]
MTSSETFSSEIPVREGRAVAGDVELHYEDWGNPEAPAFLLIMGLSAQMLLWPDEFCRRLVEKGFRVIRFDNRDIGLSTKVKRKVAPMNDLLRMARFTLGLRSPAPYTLYDMAHDCIGLLDHLGIRKANVVGASMGGMIAQILAGNHPERVLSLGVIFSSTNQPLLPPPAPRAIGPLMKGPGKGASREQLIAHSKKLMRIIGSPDYPNPEHELEAFASMLYERSYHPAGVKRQFMAVLSSGSLRPVAKRISVPTVVIHGLDDVLVRPACGRAVARAIQGARLHLIPGMGHDLPKALWPLFVDLLCENAHQAGS